MKNTTVRPGNLNSPLLDHITIITAAAEALGDFDGQGREKAKKIQKLLQSDSPSIERNCIAPTLELAAKLLSNLAQHISVHKALVQKEENRKEGKKARDDRLKAEGREKVRQALLQLKKEGKPFTILNLRWEINMLYGDAGQRSPGNLMLANPDYHMSATTLKRRLDEMPGIIEKIFGIAK